MALKVFRGSHDEINDNWDFRDSNEIVLGKNMARDVTGYAHGSFEDAKCTSCYGGSLQAPRFESPKQNLI